MVGLGINIVVGWEYDSLSGLIAYRSGGILCNKLLYMIVFIKKKELNGFIFI